MSFDLTSREPQQGRSRASLERMLEAAEQLMMRVGSDDFTLTEVAKVGNVSIGSIYLRFEGKDALIHAVHSRVLERINAEQDALLERVSAASSDLDGFTHAFVDEYAEMLLKFAPILRPIMLRAPHDPVMSKTGKDNYERFADKVKSRLLDYRSDFGLSRHLRHRGAFSRPWLVARSLRGGRLGRTQGGSRRDVLLLPARALKSGLSDCNIRPARRTRRATGRR